MSQDRTPEAVPSDFFCEHTAAESRVLALVETDDAPPSLRAVLSCGDPQLASEVASVLRAAWLGGAGPALRAEAGRVSAQLDDDPAVLFREAFGHALAGTWPVEPSAIAPSAPITRDADRRTPGGARLSELDGEVVRVTQLLEVHVHDTARLAAAARAGGWDPSGDDVLGAVMYLATHCPIPGTDVLYQEDSGQVLRASEGDEVAGWTAETITAGFSSGWRLASQADVARPDFAALFAGGDLTPRTADILHTALCTAADEAYDDVEDHGNAPVERPGDDWTYFDRLPRTTWTQDAEWRRQVARACDDLADDLEDGEPPLPRCHAEEAILHMALELAPVLAGIAEKGDDGHRALPRMEGDYNWEACLDRLFHDHDILWLYDPAFDGIDDPRSDLNRKFELGDMRPRTWFEPFDDAKPRDPDRGFRR